MSNKPSKESISLSKKIAEKYRKKIGHGDWYVDINKEDTPLLCEHGWVKSFGNDLILIPLWQISDCLDYLFDNGYIRMDIVLMDRRFVLYLMHGGEEERYYEPDGDTILEACLKGVLRDLEEKS